MDSSGEAIKFLSEAFPRAGQCPTARPGATLWQKAAGRIASGTFDDFLSRIGAATLEACASLTY